MTSRFFLALMASASVLGSAGASASAQSTGGVNTRAVPAVGSANVPDALDNLAQASDSAHSYDARALRFESSWGNVRIIRGADGQVVARGGWFRDVELEKLLAGSQTAAVQARLYEKNNFRGTLVGTAGALTTVVGLVLTTNGANNASSPALVIGGMGAMLWGAQHLTMSYSALSRALWWYNRDLPR